MNDKIRRETRFTKNGNRYGVIICHCKKCSIELCKTTNCFKKWSGFCRDCSNRYNKNKDKLANRVCKICKIEQNISQFTSKNGKYSKQVCYKCYNLKKYDINYKEYLQLFDKQDGKCAICKKPEVNINRGNKISLLAVDHCHKTGVIRGLLCFKCNTTLGHLNDNVEILQSTINYLKLHKNEK